MAQDKGFQPQKQAGQHGHQGPQDHKRQEGQGHQPGERREGRPGEQRPNERQNPQKGKEGGKDRC